MIIDKDGNKVSLQNGMVIGDVQIVLPINSEQMEALGFTEVEDPVRPNDKFYMVGEIQADGTYSKEPKNLAGLKKLLVSEVKATANAILSQTGWMIERAADPSSGVPVPPEVVTYRGQVRAACNDNESAIAAAKTVAALEAFKPTWPEQIDF